MITQYTKLDVADNSGAKRLQCIQVLKGGSARPGKRRLRRGGVGDIVVCSVRQALPTSDLKKGDKVRCVVVRTKYPTRRPDGSYVRFDSQCRRDHRRRWQPSRHACLRGGGPRVA